MRFRTALSLASLFLVCFTLAVWYTPLAAQTTGTSDSAPEAESVCGKVSSVGKAEFSLDLGNRDQLPFVINSDTKVEGKLTIGAQATVDYRSEHGKNIAIHITLVPASGFQSY